MSKNTQSTVSGSKNSRSKGSKQQDSNCVVTLGLKVDGVVKSKGPQAAVISYQVTNHTCSGVLHVGQMPSFVRAERDAFFAALQVGQKVPGLEVVGVEAPSSGRQFTSVRLSALQPLKTAQEEARKAIEAARVARQEEKQALTVGLNGKVVVATVKQMAQSKAVASEPSSFFGAFMETRVGEHKISGLLHVRAMRSDSGDKIERLATAAASQAEFELVLIVNDDGRISFSEVEVKAAKQRAAEAEVAARRATERSTALTKIREGLASGTSEPFNATVSVNRLPQGDGIDAVYCGLTVKVSSDDLALRPENLRGKGHTVKLVALSEQDGVVTAKRFLKK